MIEEIFIYLATAIVFAIVIKVLTGYLDKLYPGYDIQPPDIVIALIGAVWIIFIPMLVAIIALFLLCIPIVFVIKFIKGNNDE